MVAHYATLTLLSKSVPKCTATFKYRIYLTVTECSTLYKKRQFSARPKLAYTKISFKPTFTPTKPPTSSTLSSQAPESSPTLSSTSPSKSDDSDPVGEHAVKNITDGLSDEPLIVDEGTSQVDWSRSFHGLSVQPFSKEAAEILMAPIEINDIEVKPDGIIYLPEIKYRRILNKAFGPGGWGLAPRGETIVTGKSITREYALLAHGRLVSVARGEQDYFTPEGIPTATEGCKSNALMRCCKDLGIASELWDPRFIRKYLKENAKQVWAEHVVTKKKKQVWIRKDDEVRLPFKQV